MDKHSNVHFNNGNPLALFHNLDSYMKMTPPDCSLYSEDGYEFPIHKVSLTSESM